MAPLGLRLELPVPAELGHVLGGREALHPPGRHQAPEHVVPRQDLAGIHNVSLDEML